MTRLNSHPDYSDGYWSALDGAPLPADASEVYRAGWEAANRARNILRDAGFTEKAPGQFSKKTVIWKTP